MAEDEDVCFQRTESARLFQASDGVEFGIEEEEEEEMVEEGDDDGEITSTNKEDGDGGKLDDGPAGG